MFFAVRTTAAGSVCYFLQYFHQFRWGLFERAPQAFDKDIIHAAPPPVHGDRDLRIFENAGEVKAGELASLIGIEDSRFGVFG